MSETPQPVWRSWFILLLLHCFLLQALVLMLRVTTTYQAISLGLDGFWIGVIGGVYRVLPALLGLHMGVVVDRIGEVTSFVVGGIIIVAAALALLLIGDTLAVLVVATAVLGLGQFFCIAAEHNRKDQVGIGETLRPQLL